MRVLWPQIMERSFSPLWLGPKCISHNGAVEYQQMLFNELPLAFVVGSVGSRGKRETIQLFIPQPPQQPLDSWVENNCKGQSRCRINRKPVFAFWMNRRRSDGSASCGTCFGGRKVPRGVRYANCATLPADCWLFRPIASHLFVSRRLSCSFTPSHRWTRITMLTDNSSQTTSFHKHRILFVK